MVSRGFLISLLVLAVLLPLVCGGKTTSKHSGKGGKHHGKEQAIRRSMAHDGRVQAERSSRAERKSSELDTVLEELRKRSFENVILDRGMQKVNKKSLGHGKKNKKAFRSDSTDKEAFLEELRKGALQDVTFERAQKKGNKKGSGSNTAAIMEQLRKEALQDAFLERAQKGNKRAGSDSAAIKDALLVELRNQAQQDVTFQHAQKGNRKASGPNSADIKEALMEELRKEAMQDAFLERAQKINKKGSEVDISAIKDALMEELLKEAQEDVAFEHSPKKADKKNSELDTTAVTEAVVEELRRRAFEDVIIGRALKVNEKNDESDYASDSKDALVEEVKKLVRQSEQDREKSLALREELLRAKLEEISRDGRRKQQHSDFEHDDVLAIHDKLDHIKQGDSRDDAQCSRRSQCENSKQTQLAKLLQQALQSNSDRDDHQALQEEVFRVKLHHARNGKQCGKDCEEQWRQSLFRAGLDRDVADLREELLRTKLDQSRCGHCSRPLHQRKACRAACVDDFGKRGDKEESPRSRDDLNAMRKELKRTEEKLTRLLNIRDDVFAESDGDDFEDSQVEQRQNRRHQSEQDREDLHSLREELKNVERKLEGPHHFQDGAATSKEERDARINGREQSDGRVDISGQKVKHYPVKVDNIHSEFERRVNNRHGEL